LLSPFEGASHALTQLPLIAAAATALLLAGTLAASAATAFASTTVNVRAGAGTGYPVVDVLRAGQRVEVNYPRAPGAPSNSAAQMAG